MDAGSVVLCSECGKVVGTPYRFCGSCGSPVAARGVQPIAPQWIGATGQTAPGGYGIAPVPAGFWIRVGAYLIDSLVAGILATMAASIFAGIVLSGGVTSEAQVFVQNLFVQAVIAWAYFAFQESSAAQATLGKRACGLVVVSDTGARLTLARATGRHFAKILGSLFFGFGLIMVGFTDRKRGMHDMMAGTYVIHKA